MVLLTVLLKVTLIEVLILLVLKSVESSKREEATGKTERLRDAKDGKLLSATKV